VNEADFWKRRARGLLTEECRRAGLRHHFERVENAVAVGTPDVDYCVNGVQGKIELKFSPRHPVRASTPVLGRDNGLRRTQIIWSARRLSAGGRVHVLVGTPMATWLIDLARLPLPAWKEIEMLTADGLCQAATWHSILPSGTPLPRALLRASPRWALPGTT
jgi:hypothetical protein